MKFNNKLFFISIFLISLCCIISVSANENVYDDSQNVTLENEENDEVISVSQDSTLEDTNRGLDKIYVNASSDNDDFSFASQGWEYAVSRLDQSITQISNNGVIYVADGNYTNFIGADVSTKFKVLGCGENVVVQPQWFFQLGSHQGESSITFENIIFKPHPDGTKAQFSSNFNFINCTFINLPLETQTLIVDNQWCIPSRGYFEDNFLNCTFRDYHQDNTCINALIASKLTFNNCIFENITADSIVTIDLSKWSGGADIRNSVFSDVFINGVFDTSKKGSCSFVNNTGDVTVFRQDPPKTNLVLEIIDRYSFRSVLTDESGKPIKGAEIVWSFWGSLVKKLITDDDGVTVLTHNDTHENIHVEAKYEGIKSLNLNYEGDVDSIDVDYPQFEKDTIFTYVTDESSVTFTLKNKLNTVIGNANVTYILDGVEGTAVTDGNGSFILSNLIGEVDVYVSYNGSDNYSASSDFFYLDFPKIKTQIISDNITVGYKKGKLSLILKGNGKPLSNQTLYVVLNAKEYFPITNNNGEATIDLSLTPNVYIAQIYYAEDAKHNASEAKSLITVVDDRIKTSLTAKDITIAYGSDNKLIISLKANGKPLSNVKVNVNGQNKLTDKNGQIIMVLSSLTPKSYNFKFSFEGNDMYAPSSGSAKVTVNKAPSKITAKKATFKKAKKYSITLKAGKKAVNKVKVTIKVGKKTYTAKTNAKGKATFNLKKLTKKGKYTAVIKFKGNKLYKASSKKVKIVVK